MTAITLICGGDGGNMTQTAVAQNSNRGNFSEIAGLLQSHQTRGCSRNRGNLTEVRLLDDNKLGIVTVVAVLYVLYAHIYKDEFR